MSNYYLVSLREGDLEELVEAELPETAIAKYLDTFSIKDERKGQVSVKYVASRIL